MTAHKNRPIFSPLYCTSIMCCGSTFVLTVYVIKIILPDAELCEEHTETKYSPIGQMMVELRSFLCLDVGKITEKNEN